MMPLLALSPLNTINQLKLYPPSGKILRKQFASYFLFVDEHLITCLSSLENLTAVTAVVSLGLV